MDLKKEYDKLVRMLKTEKNFQKTCEQFMDMTDEDEFLDIGKRVESEVLSGMVSGTLAMVGIEMDSDPAPRFIMVDEFKMFHGSFFVNELPGMVFYCKEVNMGIISVLESLEGDVKFVRLTPSVTIMDAPPSAFEKSVSINIPKIAKKPAGSTKTTKSNKPNKPNKKK